ncbi:MAG: ABC transporter ATP-binding protein [Burkholderiales bacterium]
MSSVRFEGVGKRFGKVEALAGLDLAIGEGEFVSLLGPSGSGKSTTLNVLAGLLPADSGSVFIGERRVNDLPPDKRDIAMVFQNYALYPHMTVFENVAFPLRARGRTLSEQQIGDRVEDVARKLGVADLLARYPRELSGGQQQRIALGRAMVRDPMVFLLDEPLSNLDARLRIRMRKDIKALHAALGATIVYVTHDQSEAMTMSTRIAVFDRGRLQQYDTPEAIYNRPQNLFVANFVGEREINRIEGSLVRDAGGVRFEGRGVAFGLDASTVGHAGRDVVLAARAESIALDDKGEIAAVVELTELAGPDLVVYARAGDGLELCCRADPGLRLDPGTAIRLRVDPLRVFLFDPGTGLALGAISTSS